MARATATDYSGRKTDLFIFEGAAVGGDRRITLDWLEGGKLTTGLQKIAQTFALYFLTEKGSVPLLPNQGTNFITAVRLQRINTESNLQAEFALAANVAKRFMSLQADKNKYPNDERLSAVTLLNFTLDKNSGTILLKVGLTSLAGDLATIFLPVPVALK